MITMEISMPHRLAFYRYHDSIRDVHYGLDQSVERTPQGDPHSSDLEPGLSVPPVNDVGLVKSK